MESIAKKIAEVVAAVKHPPKSGRHDYQGYEYATRDDIFGVIRDELASRGVAVLPSVELSSIAECGKSRSGNTQFRAIVTVSVKMIDGDTGESTTQSWAGEAITTDDKGIAQATTQAMRFWALNSFMLLDGSDEQMRRRQNANVNRQTAPTVDTDELADAMRARLNKLDFSTDQITSFCDELARRESAQSVGEIPAARLKLWHDKFMQLSKAEARQKVMSFLQSAA